MEKPLTIDPSKLVPETVDGITGDIPVIAYTERVLAEKEAVLRKYIEENYAKIQSVEKELANLTLEVKLTSGSKKKALEHLRRKIELSSEEIKTSKAKEEAAKKAWEAASKVVRDLETEKDKLCVDLNLMVQENALQQYQKLEELTRKLDALNPDGKGGFVEALEGLRAKIAPHGPPSLGPSIVSADVLPSTKHMVNGVVSEGGSANENLEKQTSAPVMQAGTSETFLKNSSGAEDGQNVSSTQTEGEAMGKKVAAHVPARGRGRGRGRARGGGPLVLKPGNSGSQWTGAGFNVEDGLE